MSTQQRTNVLDTVIKRAIQAGLTTPEETAQALAHLEATKLPTQVLEDFYEEIRQDTQQEAAAYAQAPPQDEQDLLQWLANAARNSPWTQDAQTTYLSPFGTHQALLRITYEEGHTLRLAVSYCNDEETEEDFDDYF